MYTPLCHNHIWAPYMIWYTYVDHIWTPYMIWHTYEDHIRTPYMSWHTYDNHIWTSYMICHTYDNHIWTSYMIRTNNGISTTKTVHIWGAHMVWSVHIWFDIQIIYRFQTIYDLTYDLKSLLTYDPIYGLARRSYVARIWSYVDRIWFESRFHIWFETRYMTTIYGLVDIWSHTWSVNPMRWN